MSIKSFQEAKELYERVGSGYGEALCDYSLGVLYKSKVAELNIEMEEEEVYQKAKDHFERSHKYFN